MLKQTKEVNIASPDMFDITAKVGEELKIFSKDKETED